MGMSSGMPSASLPVVDQLAGQGLGLELTDAAKVHLAGEGYDPAMGARPLRRAIQRQGILIQKQSRQERLRYTSMLRLKEVVAAIEPYIVRDREKEGVIHRGPY